MFLPFLPHLGGTGDVVVAMEWRGRQRMRCGVRVPSTEADEARP